MLDVQSLSKSYDTKRILDTISFTINPGEIVGLVGENGAGKSTLLHILAGLTKLGSGAITLNSQSYESKPKKIRRHIGFVPQEIALWENFTVKENMVFFERLAWNNTSKKALKQLCSDMGLDKWDEPVKILSGGMKRKLNIAISLIHAPDLLLLDEPTAGIDLKSRKEIGAYLSNLAKINGKMILYTSHDMDEIMQLCDQIYCLGNDPFYHQVLKEYGQQPVLL
ncbi:ABC transporter ATP-binding protein [Lentibacillus amyloliquefaciens]|uniref:ABC transporter ATP-binding protein n=1 Tax=Lentibacillus amyloliquefaciens TaxID=1472767 RepID=A0A0U4FKI0_9BACI|nr:ABC transporter ATP-binding protein [Lentibacillus amyloliquefaciens]ALX48260.1 ABC transporter ATP-binding protein [Lentibacillus amyloliquefaciens]